MTSIEPGEQLVQATKEAAGNMWSTIGNELFKRPFDAACSGAVAVVEVVVLGHSIR